MDVKELRLIIRQEVLKVLDDYNVQRNLSYSMFGSDRPLTKGEVILLIREQTKRNQFIQVERGPSESLEQNPSLMLSKL